MLSLHEDSGLSVLALYHKILFLPVVCIRTGSVVPPQFVDCRWTSPEKHELAANIVEAIEASNKLAKIVISEVLRHFSPEERAGAITWFIKVSIESRTCGGCERSSCLTLAA